MFGTRQNVSGLRVIANCSTTRRFVKILRLKSGCEHTHTFSVYVNKCWRSRTELRSNLLFCHTLYFSRNEGPTQAKISQYACSCDIHSETLLLPKIFRINALRKARIRDEDWKFLGIKSGGNLSIQISTLWPILKLSIAISKAYAHTFLSAMVIRKSTKSITRIAQKVFAPDYLVTGGCSNIYLSAAFMKFKMHHMQTCKT